MKHYWCIIVFYCLVINSVFGQKRVLTNDMYKSWPSVISANISANGEFAYYAVNNDPIGSNSTTIVALKTKWQKKIIGVEPYSSKFTSDSKWLVCKNNDGSIALISLGTDSLRNISNVVSFKLCQINNHTILGYRTGGTSPKLTLLDLQTQIEKTINNVIDYWFLNDNKSLIYSSVSDSSGKNKGSINWMDLQDGDIKSIWNGERPISIIFDKTSTQLAFITMDTVTKQNKVWYYNRNESLSHELSFSLDSKTKLEKLKSFSSDGERLFVELSERNDQRLVNVTPLVKIWSYSDAKLCSEQLNEAPVHSFTAVISLSDPKVIQLDRLNEELQLSGEVNDDYALIRKNSSGGGEGNWNIGSQQSSAFLVSTKTGKRILINNYFFISPQGKFAIYFDPIRSTYFSYSIFNGVVKNITNGIKTNWIADFGDDYPQSKQTGRGIAIWGANDQFVLIYDRFDIWKLDPTGRKKPLNLTNSYGRKNRIVFQLENDNLIRTVVKENDTLLLSAFSLTNKKNGFFIKSVHSKNAPSLLTMGDYLYHYVSDGQMPIKAAASNVYLVFRMSVKESPNYFATTNFRSFKSLSDCYPEKDISWFSTELCSWRMSNGGLGQGILYKPANFNYSKKYPVILTYYQKETQRLNFYLKPEASHAGLNIPLAVSNGYLVFVPDIHFKIGEVGKNIVDYVCSAAKYIAKKPFVNSRRMGIHGWSFGGYATNYLITQTSMFAAACSASGISDLISDYSNIYPSGSSHQGYYEIGQQRMGSTPWDSPSTYQRYSPILHLKNVTTPLLLFHTTGDEGVPFLNAIELFTGLRRLGKKVWLLQYEGDHGVFGDAAYDFDRRHLEFFDHFLKGAPAPSWLADHLPSRVRN